MDQYTDFGNWEPHEQGWYCRGTAASYVAGLGRLAAPLGTMLRVGVDTGGTSTDAVVLDSRNTVRGWSKAATSPDVLTGVLAAVQGALQDAGAGGASRSVRCCVTCPPPAPHHDALLTTAADPAHVSAVMLGTTQFVNACITLRGLAPVALVRLCGPATRSLPPFSDLPPGLRGAVGGAFVLAAGGCEIDGRVAPPDEPQLHRIARQILSAGLRCVVVSCVFGPLRPDQERMAAAILQHEAAAAASAGAAGGGRDDAGDPPLVCCQSHAVTGQLGLLERENAAVLNAALLPLARRVVPACQAALAEAGIRARLFLTCNDGTLMPAANAQQVCCECCCCCCCCCCWALKNTKGTPSNHLNLFTLTLPSSSRCQCSHFKAGPSTASEALRC